jgi:hypothetical protein
MVLSKSGPYQPLRPNGFRVKCIDVPPTARWMNGVLGLVITVMRTLRQITTICFSSGALLVEVCRSDSLLCKQDWPSIWWLGMFGETGRRVMDPIRGSGDFLAYGSPSISAHPRRMLGFKARGRIVGEVSVCT